MDHSRLRQYFNTSVCCLTSYEYCSLTYIMLEKVGVDLMMIVIMPDLTRPTHRAIFYHASSLKQLYSVILSQSLFLLLTDA